MRHAVLYGTHKLTQQPEVLLVLCTQIRTQVPILPKSAQLQAKRNEARDERVGRGKEIANLNVEQVDNGPYRHIQLLQRV